jgi:hypothetical protein
MAGEGIKKMGTPVYMLFYTIVPLTVKGFR